MSQTWNWEQNNWKFVRISKRLLKLVNTKTGMTDYPIRYDNGIIAYNYPERIPQYVKQTIEQYFNQKEVVCLVIM